MIRKLLKNVDLLHVRDHNDIELIRSCGVSLASIARVLGYQNPQGLYKRLIPYRDNVDPLPLSVSALLECGLWRLGAMDRYIKVKQLRDGHGLINWDRLPPNHTDNAPR